LRHIFVVNFVRVTYLLVLSVKKSSLMASSSLGTDNFFFGMPASIFTLVVSLPATDDFGLIISDIANCASSDS